MPNTFDDLLPHIRPLEGFLADPDISEIMINNGGARVFTERSGRLRHHPNVTIKPEFLLRAIHVIARMVEQEPSTAYPLLNARLADGSRVSATLAPQSPDGHVMTIRKFGHRYTLDQLVNVGSVTAAQAAVLRQAVLDQKNILIAGGTGTGKTTMVNALADIIPDDERVLLIESTSELSVGDRLNYVRFEARVAESRADMPWPAIEISDLLKHALRFRPDRIIIGEVRGVEAWDLIQALNTGHRGSMSTIHGNSANGALLRLAEMADRDRPAYKPVARSIELVVQIERNHKTGRRQVMEVATVTGYEAANERFTLVDVQ
jgi:pilus assembly protein CpaF